MHFNKFIFIALLLLSAVANAQTYSVSGTVKGDDGAPVVGAVVSIQGTSKGVITDYYGKFVMTSVKADDVIDVSLLGYKTKSVRIEGRKELAITLEQEITELDDAVVIGFGSVKKRDLTGSVSSIDAKSLIEKSPVNVFEAMQGSMAGVQITTDSGSPGAGATMRIRGTGTFEGGAEPLYVVDDVLVEDISDINPKDVASIEVLKDAASSAIYGSRSANGVVLITTKNGEKSKAAVNADITRSYGRISHMMELTPPDMYRYYNRERRRIIGTNEGAWREITDSLRFFANGTGNQYEYLMRTAEKLDASVNVSGSTDKMKYYLGMGLLNEDGIIVNSSYRRFNTRMNSSYNATKKITIGNNFNFSFTDNNGIDAEQVVNSLYNWLPHYQVVDSQGDVMPAVGGKASTYLRAMREINETRILSGNGQIYLNWQINKYLKLRMSLAGNMRVQRKYYFKPSVLLSSTGHTVGYDQTSMLYNWRNENYLSYDRKFGSHKLSAMAGMGVYDYHNEYAQVYGQDFNTDYIWTLNNATMYPVSSASSLTNYSNQTEHGMLSFYGRFTYDWKSRYLFAANIREDGSSRFAAGNRWGFFPSASLGWRFSDESFMKWAKPFLTDSKIRISYGVTGNENLGNSGNYAYWPIYSNNGSYNGVGGMTPDLVYEALSWERTKQMNVGIDASAWKGRISLTADYYNKDTDNLLYKVNVPKETGYDKMTMNVGSLNNSGVELSVKALIVQSHDWTLSANFNISRNVGRIVKLADHESFTTGLKGIVLVQEGELMGEFYGVKHDGIFAYDESNAFTPDWRQLEPVFDSDGSFSHYLDNGAIYTGEIKQKRVGTEVLKGGDVNWLDAPGDMDGVIDWSRDRVKLGCSQADFFGGGNFTLTWKDVSLYAAFNYSIGGDIFNCARYNRNGMVTAKCAPSPDWINNIWLNPGDDALYPIPDYNRSVNKNSLADFWIEDGSFVRLQSLKLSYTLPSRIVKIMGLRSLGVSIFGNNLLTWTNYSGFDPEFSGDILAPGIDNGKYPRRREFGMSLSIGI